MATAQETLNTLLQSKRSVIFDAALCDKLRAFAATQTFIPGGRKSAESFTALFVSHVEPVITRLMNNRFGRASLDGAIKDALNKGANGAANSESGLALRLHFQECLGQHMDTVPDATPEPSPPPRRSAALGAQARGLFAAVERSIEPEPQRAAPFAPQSGGLLSGVAPQSIKSTGGHVLLAFSYPHRGVCKRFESVFHNFNAPHPFIGRRGRALFDTPSPVAAEPHHDGDNKCWIELTNATSGEPLPWQSITDPALIEKAKQFCLHLLLDQRLIGHGAAIDDMGYNCRHDGARAAQEQLRASATAAPAGYHFGARG